MSYFGLNPTQDNQLLAHAAENPIIAGEAGFFDGGLDGAVNGLYTGIVAKPALALSGAAEEALSPVARFIDSQFGTSTEQFLQQQHQMDVNTVRGLMPNAATTGTAGQVLHSLFDIGPQAIIGTLAAGPAGGGILVAGLQGYADYEDSVAKGVDKSTAMEKATVTGVTTGIGTVIPMSIGLRSIGAGIKGQAAAFAGDIAYAAGTNVAMGMAHRGLSSEILRKGGYDDMASQYRVFDAQALAIDAVLGVAFGGLGHFMHTRTGRAADAPEITRADIDAALATNASLHIEIDSPPGLPVDPQSRAMHVRAMEKALADIAAGRPVDVSAILPDANFTPKNLDAYIADVNRVAKETYPDLPLIYMRNGAAITPDVIDAKIAELQPFSEQLVSRGARQALVQEVHQLQRNVDHVESQLQQLRDTPVAGRGKGLSAARQRYIEQVRALEGEQSKLRGELSDRQRVLTDNSEGGVNYDARADISRLQQGIIPDRFREEIYQRVGVELAPEVSRFESFDSSASAQSKATRTTPPNAPPEGVRDNVPEGLEAVDIDSRTAAQALENNPDMVIPIEDADGNIVNMKAVDLMSRADEEIVQAQKDGNLFDAAVACFLRG